MSRFVEKKWRPPLVLILGGSLMAILVLPIWGAFIADLLAPAIGRANAVYSVAVGAFFFTLGMGWLLWRLILGPVQELARHAEAIRGGETPRALEQYGTPEIGELAGAVLEMAEVLQHREMAVRGYTDHVTHELKTPLTAIRGAAELLSGDETLGDEAQRLITTIENSEKRAVRLLAAARQIAAARAPDHRGTSTVAELLPEVRSRFNSLKITGEGEDVALPLAKSGMQIVLAHLAENSVEAGARHLHLRAFDEGERPVLVVSDDGPGISGGNAQQVFEPYFTTRREMGGTGMGLAIVQTMLLAHGGRVALVPVEEGAAFRIEF